VFLQFSLTSIAWSHLRADAAGALTLVEFSSAAHATLRCACQAEPGLIALGTRTGSARDAPDLENLASIGLGSAAALRLVCGFVASTRAIDAVSFTTATMSANHTPVRATRSRW
jgi:hypothetical protein